MSGLHGPRLATGVDATSIAHEFCMQVAVPPDGAEHMRVVLAYDVTDPYAVSAEFNIAPGVWVTWVFARQLLSQGLNEPAGEGDVRVWPSRLGREPRVNIALMSEDCHAHVQATEAEVAGFLRESYSLCRPGKEHRHLDVGEGLRALLEPGTSG